MKRLFDFIQNVAPDFNSLLGYPTIKIYSDVAEVYFDCFSVICDLSVLIVDCDSFRMFTNQGSDCITLVYCFNLDNHD